MRADDAMSGAEAGRAGLGADGGEPAAAPSRTSDPPGVRPSALAPLSYPVFREIWFASLVSNLGGLIQ